MHYNFGHRRQEYFARSADHPGARVTRNILYKHVVPRVEDASEMQAAPQEADGRMLQGAWRRTEDIDM